MSEVHVDSTGHAEPNFSTKAIWKTFWILLFITIAELLVAILYYEKFLPIPKHFINGIFVIGTLAKAYFIIAEFMHLGHENKNLIFSLAFPAMLFIWFVIAFLWDGGSYRDLRNKYDSHYYEQSQKPVGKNPGVE